MEKKKITFSILRLVVDERAFNFSDFASIPYREVEVLDKDNTNRVVERIDTPP